MPKKPKTIPKKVSLISKTVALVRRNRIKSFMTAFTVFIGIPGAIASITAIEPAAPALHYWVRERVDEVIKMATNIGDKNNAILRDLQVEAAEGKRDATTNDITKWQVELRKTTDPNSKDMITRQLEKLENTKSKLDAQIKTLNKLRGVGGEQ